MSGFSADWLALREPYDARARNPAVLDAVIAALKGYPSIRIVDLACGTGSTLRALSATSSSRSRIGGLSTTISACWRARRRSTHPADVTVAGVPLDLNRDLEAVLDGPVDLITTSALLDLVSEAWLERLAVEIAARSIPVYAALSYDGRIELSPADPLDTASHCRGERASAHRQGFWSRARADGGILSRSRDLKRSAIPSCTVNPTGSSARTIATFKWKFLAGWASAAREIGDLSLADTVGWLTRRRDAVAAGRSSIRVGHVDFFARPIGTR